jgi:phosphohistidine phosphatase
MKTLLLVRHAKTVPAGPSQTDHSRSLEDVGITDAGKLAQFLSEQALMPDRVLVSSANRTQSTARILLKAFESSTMDVLISDDLYLADVVFLEQMVNETSDQVNTLMIVGHNPGLSELACQYDHAVGGLRPAQMLWVQFDIEHWSEAEYARVSSTRLV